MASAPIEPMKERLDAAKQMLEAFRLERIAYLAVTILAILLLVGFVVALLVRSQEPDWKSLSILFGPAGMVTYSTSRLLVMWRQVIRVIFGELAGKD